MVSIKNFFQNKRVKRSKTGSTTREHDRVIEKWFHATYYNAVHTLGRGMKHLKKFINKFRNPG